MSELLKKLTEPRTPPLSKKSESPQKVSTRRQPWMEEREGHLETMVDGGDWGDGLPEPHTCPEAQVRRPLGPPLDTLLELPDSQEHIHK